MRKLFIPILFFIAFLAAIYLVVPQFSKLENLQIEVANKQDELEQTANYFVNLGNALSELSSYQEYLSKQRAAQKAISKDKSELASRIKEAFIVVNIKGSVSSFESFLRNIEKSSRMIEVEQVSLKDSKEKISEITLLIKVFHY